MAGMGEGTFEPSQDLRDFFFPSWWRHSPVGPPQMEFFDPSEGEVGSEVTITGHNLEGAKFMFGPVAARVLRAEADEAVVEVPEVYGYQLITAENYFGSASADQPFNVVTEPRGFTFRGDALSYGGDLYSSIRSIGLNQPYLVLMVLPSDLTLPTGQTEATLRNDLISKLGPRPPQPPFPANTANGFWWEATYQKVSFDFDVHPSRVNLPKTMAEYFQDARPKAIQASGATYPITFPTAETLTLEGDPPTAGGANFTVTVTFPQGSTTLDSVVGRINDRINAEYAGPGSPPLRATRSTPTAAGQLRLETTRAAASAVLNVTGAAVTRLGLAVPPAGSAVETPGLDAVVNFSGAIVDSLTARVQGMTYDAAKAYLSGYAGVIIAFAGPDSLLRSKADLGADRYTVRLPQTPAAQPSDQFSLSAVCITTGDPFEVFCHEIGHNLGLPDLYQEPGAPIAAGVELDRWDIMAADEAARHPTTWSKAYKSLDAATNSTWMPPGEIDLLTAPDPSVTTTRRVLLAPLESPMPANLNLFAATHPGVPLRHAMRLELEPNRSLYIENRQRSPYTSADFGNVNYSRNLPGQGVIVTDAVNNSTGLPVLRKEVVLLTPYADPLDSPGEQRTVFIFTATNTIRVTAVEIVGFGPQVYLVEVAWGQGPYFDFRIRDWNPPPWESPDIWIDTRVDNAWDVYKHSNASLNPGVPGNPVLNGDRSRVGWESRVYARVWNDGSIPKTGVQVSFEIVVPANMGPSVGTRIGDTTVNLPAGGPALAMVPWTPASANEGHICVRARVAYDTDELNANNNLAQENITDWYLAGSPPYDPVEFPFQVTNPLPRRAQVRMRARGLLPGWFLDVDPAEFWLEPEETIIGAAQIRADERVPIENDDIQAPIITLEALAQQGDTWVPFGGISGTAHAVHKAKLEVDVSREEESIQVNGYARTEVAVIRHANVSLRLLAEDRWREVDFHQTTTDGGGRFSATLMLQGGALKARFLEVLLSPTLGTGPAEAELIDLA